MSQHDVVIYVRDKCSHCNELLSFFEALNLPYELKNVSKSDTAKKELRQKNLYGTPVTFIDQEVFLGVPKKRIKQKLNIHSYYSF